MEKKTQVRLLCLFLLMVVLLVMPLVLHKARGPAKKPPKEPNSIAVPIDIPRTLVPTQKGLTKEGIIALTNKARSENGGLPPLSENAQLNAIASARLKDMFDRQYFGHVAPNGEAVTDVAHKVGYPYRVLSENIASGMFGSDEKIVEGWMQSPGHRKNILLANIAEIGVAVGKGKLDGRDTWIGVQVFGAQSPSLSTEESSKNLCTKPDSSLLEAVEAAQSELNRLNDSASALRDRLETDKSEFQSPDPGGPYWKVKERTEARKVLIREHNERVNRYNRLVAEISNKQSQLQESIARYNGEVEQYNECMRR
jgi:uncharacterized protein YkwD